jgi:hypothetical protein
MTTREQAQLLLRALSRVLADLDTVAAGSLEALDPATLSDYTPAETVLGMTNRQEQEFARLGLPFGGLWGRPLHAPELASARKRIKTRFTPASEAIHLFFPPKWGINGQLPDLPVSIDAKPA